MRCLIVILSLLMAHVGGSVAQVMVTERYNVAALDVRSGLPHNNVNQIFADSRGFIWVATSGGGVARYDGYTFFKPVMGVDRAAESISCRAVAEDGFHRLWVAYDEETLVIDLNTMQCVVPEDTKTDIARFLKKPSVKVYCDTQGGLWQVTGDSIFRYSFNQKGQVSRIAACGYRANTPDITICDIDNNGSVWVTVENGLYRISEMEGKLVRKTVAPAFAQLKGAFITGLLKVDKTVWISTNNGLFAYNLYNSTLSSFHHTTDPQSLPHDFTTALAMSPEGQLIVGTLGGVCVMNSAKTGFLRWNSSSEPLPMPSDFVHCLLVRDRQVWIGTETAGVVKLSPQPFLLRNFAHSANPQSISPNPVNAIYVEPDGTQWVGTVEGGLNRKAPGGGFSHLTMANSGLSHNSVSLLEPDNKRRLWVGTWGGGLNCVSLDQPAKVQQEKLSGELAHLVNYIGAMAYDKYNGGLWIGANDGVFFYDPEKGQLSDPFQGNRNVRGCIGSIIDADRHLWIGCITGVCDIDLNKRDAKGQFSVRRLYFKLDNPDSRILEKISCFCLAKDGSLWMGSNGYGLYHRVVDKKTGKEKFLCFSTENGLANNSVKGIAEDVQGRLWITTENGLSVYDPQSDTFSNYYEKDGLLSQQFYFNSAVRGPDGTIFLGSVGGLMEMRGQNDDFNTPMRLTFTRLDVDNQTVSSLNSRILDADISQAKKIRLHESNKSMVIYFSTLTFMGSEQEHFYYRLRGFEDDWIPLKQGEHSVRYTNLTAGNYTFEVKCTGPGKSDGQVISILVDVAPYFWRSWWFLLLVTVAALAALSIAYRRYVERLRRKEAEKLLTPIRKVLDESEAPEQLLSQIHTIIDSHKSLQQSIHRSIEADNEDTMRRKMSFMEKAMAVMEQNYSNSEFGIEQFAEAVGMSRSQVSKRLHEETALSTGQFIRNYRLNMARKMLVENVAHRNIAEIAYKVGFNDPKYFTRCFTNLYGVSPSNYIEKNEEVDKNPPKIG